MIGRREFLRGSALGMGGLLISRYPLAASATSTDSRIEILLDEPLGVITPDIYGHFTENLGGVIYDGIWVGENSKVPNVGGIRKQLVEEMRQIKPPVVRYPGGCFADSYDWRDGIGPAANRPRRTNFWGDIELAGSPASHKYDPNQFGTNEFIHFCRLIGSQPYLAANLRSLPAEEFHRWVEYCNSPAGSTTLAETHAAAGYADPFQVRFWGVENESWGCGGNFTAQEYAVEFRRFTTWVPRYGMDLSFIASGPNDDSWDWTRGFLEEIVRQGPEELRSIYGLALHYYSWNLSRGRTSDWDEGKREKVPVFLEVEELHRLFEELALRERAMIICDALTGMRRSELMGLQWHDLDFIERRINIVRSVVDQSIGKCKTEASCKPVVMDEHIAQALLAWPQQSTYTAPTDWVWASTKMAGKHRCGFRPSCGTTSSRRRDAPASPRTSAGTLSGIRSRL